MKRSIILFLMISLSQISRAQNQPVADLTVFSEDGDKFFLILNGEKQNQVAQSNIRIEELPQPYYNVKIIFEDPAVEAIAKGNLMVAGGDGVMMDVTYKLKRDKSGNAKLRYYSAIPVQQNFIPSSGMYVHHYGRPDMENNAAVITSTTTTTIVNPAVTTVSMNTPGMNVTINQPAMAQSTTITQTSSSNASTNSGYQSSNNGSNCDGYPMDGRDFDEAKKQLSDISFEDSRLSTAKNIANSNCICVNQIVQICNLFNFEENKLAFAEYAYKHSTDPKNYYKVVGVFNFDSNKQQLNQFIERN